MARPKKTCTIAGCDRPHVGRGFCMRHYQQMRYHGKIQVLPQPNYGYPRREEGPRDLSSYVMLSSCHKKEVKEGPQHGYGKQYCTKCFAPCLWKWHHKNDIKIS